MTVFRPSHYQQAIFDFVRSGQGDGVVRATAGSGKTTTLVEIARQLPDDLSALFLAFNTHTADELKARLPYHVKASTIHSLGRRSLTDRFPQVKTKAPTERKSRHLIREHIGQMKLEFAVSPDQWKVVAQYLGELLRYAMLNRTDTKVEEDVAALAVEYNLTPPEDPSLEVQCHREVRTLLRARLNLFEQDQVYDFDDMLYLPIILKLKVPQYDFVFVDEAQDLSPLTLELVLRALAPGGRRLFVGDERQAIYGFAGADADSLGRISARTNATVLPLSVTYRCPRSHVDLARRLAPELEAAPGAKEGHIYVIKAAWLARWVRPGDLVICRYTAPLVEHCLALARQGIRAVVRGVDIGKNLISIARPLFAQGLADWTGTLSAYRTSEEARILKHATTEADAERLLAFRNDLLDSLAALTAEVVSKGGMNAAQLTDYIAAFFSDEDGAPVIFSTVHKAKGKEAERVFLLYPEAMPAVYAKTANAARGEACVQFVALTRAKHTLIFVEQEERASEAWEALQTWHP